MEEKKLLHVGQDIMKGIIERQLEGGKVTTEYVFPPFYFISDFCYNGKLVLSRCLEFYNGILFSFCKSLTSLCMCHVLALSSYVFMNINIKTRKRVPKCSFNSFIIKISSIYLRIF